MLLLASLKRRREVYICFHVNVQREAPLASVHLFIARMFRSDGHLSDLSFLGLVGGQSAKESMLNGFPTIELTLHHNFRAQEPTLTMCFRSSNRVGHHCISYSIFPVKAFLERDKVRSRVLDLKTWQVGNLVQRYVRRLEKDEIFAKN